VRGLLQSYNTNGWVRSIVDLVSAEVATTKWRVYKPVVGRTAPRLSQKAVVRKEQIKRALASGDLMDSTTHEVLQILRAPSPDMSGMAAMKLIQIHLDLAGETFLHLRRAQTGTIVGFDVIPPTSVIQVPTQASPSYQIQATVGLINVPATDVIWIKHHSPLDPSGRGTGLGSSLAGHLQIQEHITESLKAIFARGGAGTTVVSVAPSDTNSDSADVAEDIQKIFDGNIVGPDKQGQVVVLPGKITSATLNSDLRQLEVVQIEQGIRDYVRQVFAIPPEILGDVSSSNRSTAEAAEYHLQAYCVLPRLEFLAAELAHRLLPLIDQDAILDFDDPRPQQTDLVATLMAGPYTAPSFTINECRKLAALPPIAEGDKHLLPPPGSDAKPSSPSQ
jgi:HK97 family phage portal protein